MRELAIAALLIFFLNFTGASAQEIVTDLSSYDVELRHSFTGKELTLFGAIKSSPRDLEQTTYDVVLVVKGVERPYTVRQKERVLGIWVNTSSLTFPSAPGYYSIASTRPLAEIASPALIESLKLGAEYHLTNPSDEAEKEELATFITGFVENRRRAGLYRLNTDQMEIISGTLFKANFFFPSNVPSGPYEATAYLFKKGRLLSKSSQTITIGQIGIERTIFNLAREHPALYGLLAVLLAVGFGWGGTVFIQRRTTLG